MQRVEIAKALAIDAKVVIMDEPTALAEKEIEGLFEVIRDLQSHGIAILYISHRLDEIFRIADRVTVMRDGKIVDTLPIDDLDEDKLVRLMVGRDIENLYPKTEVEIGDVVLRAEGITRGHVLKDCSFEVRSGEILGFAGLVGAGRGTGPGSLRGRPHRFGNHRARWTKAAHQRASERDRCWHRLPYRGPQGRGAWRSSSGWTRTSRWPICLPASGS